MWTIRCYGNGHCNGGDKSLGDQCRRGEGTVSHTACGAAARRRLHALKTLFTAPGRWLMEWRARGVPNGAVGALERRTCGEGQEALVELQFSEANCA